MNTGTRNPILADIETTPEKWKRLTWEISRSILIGVGGTLLMFLFLATFLHLFTTIKFIPWIIAFNGAVSGYSLVDRTRESIRHKKLISALTGAMIAAVTSAVLILMSNYHLGENLLPLSDVAFFILVGVIGSELGTLLGVKYFKL